MAENTQQIGAELQMLEAMTSEERKLHFTTQMLEMEESTLKSMMDSMRSDDDTYHELRAKAKEHLTLFDEDGDDAHLKSAETYITLSDSFKDNRYTIKDIREQRKRVQCQRTKLRKMPGVKSNS